MAGSELGKNLGYLAMNNGGIWFVILIIVGLVFGAIIVCAEPAVWVLTKQVEEISGGAIKRKVLLVALSCGVCIAVGLAMVRVIFGFHIAYILLTSGTHAPEVCPVCAHPQAYFQIHPENY